MGDSSSASSRRGEKRKLEEDSVGVTPAASVASARRHLNDPADEVTMKTSVKKLLVEGPPHQPSVPNAHSLAKGEEKQGDGVGAPLAFTAPPPIQNNKDAVKRKKNELESQAAVYRKLARKSFQIHISLLNTTVSRTVVLPACKDPLFFFSFSSLGHLSNDNPNINITTSHNSTAIEQDAQSASNDHGMAGNQDLSGTVFHLPFF